MNTQQANNSDSRAVVTLVDANRLCEAILAVLDSRLLALEKSIAEGLKSPPDETHGELEPLLTTRDIATILGCETRSVHRWLREGVVPGPIRIGGVLRWYAPSIRAWLSSKQSTTNLNGGTANERA